MSQLRIAVLNAAESDYTTRNFRREVDASLAEFDVSDGQFPQTEPTAFDGAIVTGSRTSVYWDEPWMETTKQWVSDAIDHDLPFLGVCWGHQLLADVLGGTVADMGCYELGYSEIEHTGESRLFDGIDERFVAFTSHSDEVAQLPPEAEPLAENEYSNHAFRTDHVFGVQFHPEYDMQTARQLVERKDISEQRRESVFGEITEKNYQRASQAKLVFDNFLEYVHEHRTTEAATETRDVSA